MRSETAALREALRETDRMLGSYADNVHLHPGTWPIDGHATAERLRKNSLLLAATEAVREPAVREPERLYNCLCNGGCHTGRIAPCTDECRDHIAALREPEGRDAGVASTDKPKGA